MGFATGIAVGTALSNSSHCHSHMSANAVLAMYIAFTLISLPAFLIWLYKHIKAKKKNRYYCPNIYEEVGGVTFVFIQIVALFIVLILFIHYLIS